VRSVTSNLFPTEDLLMDSLLISHVESSYLNADMCNLETSQKDESRAQLVIPRNGGSQPRCRCTLGCHLQSFRDAAS